MTFRSKYAQRQVTSLNHEDVSSSGEAFIAQLNHAASLVAVWQDGKNTTLK